MANSNKDNYTDIPKNYQKFVLVQSPHVISKDYGYEEEDVIYLLNLISINQTMKNWKTMIFKMI